ncbi:hypothetical protein ACOCJ4_05725 [Knoellia sp. CPCC 206435]|uniref:hypothetical protein n=1 Tax=Knoellia terrae TaxID=3404797 RepID=UPI003B4364A8
MPPKFDLAYQSAERANCDPWQWYTLDDFVEAGFDRDLLEAQAWLDADVYPDQAMAYKALGMSPEDAWAWGMVPEAVRSFVDCGFQKDETWDWAYSGAFGYEAMFWRDAGYTPTQAAALRTVTKPIAQAVLWAVTGLPFADALEHATHGANPADFLTLPETDATAGDAAAEDLLEDDEVPYDHNFVW